MPVLVRLTGKEGNSILVNMSAVQTVVRDLADDCTRLWFPGEGDYAEVRETLDEIESKTSFLVAMANQ